MKHNVVYTKKVVSHDPKTGLRSEIAAGTKGQLTDEQLQGVRHAVRLVKAKEPAKSKQPD